MNINGDWSDIPSEPYPSPRDIREYPLKARFGNNYWPELLAGKPVPVHLSSKAAISVDTVERTMAELNQYAPQVGLAAFVYLIPGDPKPGDTGLFIFGSPEEIPAWLREVRWWDPGKPGGFSAPGYTEPANINRIWVNWAGVAHPGELDPGILHEWMHALGLGDHYFLQSRDGREGNWGPLSLMAGGVTTLQKSDVQDLKDFYGALLKEVIPMPGTKWDACKSNVINFKVRPGPPPNSPRLARLTISSASQEVDAGQAVVIRGFLVDHITGQGFQEYDPSVPPPSVRVVFGARDLFLMPDPQSFFEVTFTAPPSGDIFCWAEYGGDA